MEATYVMNGNFKNIKSIKEHATYLCSRCRTTLPLNDAQTSCSECPAITDEEIPDFFCEKVKIISITNKKLKYSKAICFKAEFNGETIQSEMIFERSSLYDKVILFEEGLSKVISGWMEGGTIELLNVD